MTLMCPSARRLGAGGALTVLQFSQLFGCVHVMGLNTCFGACSWFKHTEVRFGEPETTSLKEENGRKPIFLIFWPIEVP
jgi:hypothetical protein